LGSESVGISPDNLNKLVRRLEALAPLAKPVTPTPPIGANLIERVEALETRLLTVESDLLPINSTIDFLVVVLLSLISSLNGLIVLLLGLQDIAISLRDLALPAVKDRVTEVDAKIDEKTFDVNKLTASGDWQEGHKNG